MAQGYFLIALGEYYVKESVVLTQTIRKQGDDRPVSLLVNDTCEDYARSTEMFDQYVKFDPNGPIWQESTTNFEKHCLFPRIHFDKYIPYDETMIVDTDVLCQYSTEKLWTTLTNQPIDIRMLGRYNDATWHWGTISEVSQAYGKHVPHVHGGFFYLRKSDFVNKFFDYCRQVFFDYDKYKCKRWFRDGRVDEIIFALAHAQFDIRPVEFDDIPIMTFNYNEQVQIPSRLQTEGNQNVELEDFIPFVHMFDKMTGSKFRSLYHRIMNAV